ncbi:uncharacterized protein MAM_05383 [Metarhizium album ARSEF 1941]|uniref:ER transporter 6TM N-terminal domain-containing protein n=1 Tax=Metarhizium album (strain ARSEF 1941) TaxID=1081103 RepID=A0A0B2WTN8_METAS|nr:uncharacterized protein MAM_05383 [Metarhizium album ARSEF 1941]KHN96827.1 hypothetical protein MAM_05383 [Metarhizium album ARSEF 1941]
MYQSPTISAYFTTQGYLIPIVSVLAVASLPRDKFTQTLILDVLFICVAAAVSLLAMWSSVQARIHTSPSAAHGPIRAPLPYNSSQSAVCAVWLFVNIWLANLVRAKMPSFNLPAVIYSILVNTSLTAGPTIDTTTAAEAFVRELLLANLFGMGLAAGVCYFVFPLSSRMVVMDEFGQLIGLLRKVVRLQAERVAAWAHAEEQPTAETTTEHGEEQHMSQWRKAVMTRGKAKLGAAATATGLSETTRDIRRLAGKLYGDIAFAKRDVAWGKLDSTDLADMFKLMYTITIPLTGIGVLEEAHFRGPEVSDRPVGRNRERSAKASIWIQMAEKIRPSFQRLTEPIEQGLEHAGICLEILPGSRHGNGDGHFRADVEGRGGQIHPGDERLRVVNAHARDIYMQEGNALQDWLCERLQTVDEDDASQSRRLTAEDDGLASDHSQLWVSVYLEQLMFTASEATQNLVVFADRKVSEGTMKHKRLVLPSKYRLWGWLKSVARKRNSGAAQNPEVLEPQDDYYGDFFWPKKDPERLPPRGTWQHIGVLLGKVSSVLGSKESAFGFRVACAAMSVSILAFLEKTQSFFQEQRLLWAMFTIALGMTMTSGQSIFGFFCRVGATCVAMASSIAIWYIPDQKTPGIIVLLWLFIFVENYFIKFPQLATPVIITVTTQLVIVGYELQVRTLGEAVATRSGQPYYPIYLLGPYRLACIAGGSLVAFFWTFFPCPLTDRTWLRQDLSAIMYLLGSYFGVLSSTMEAQLRGEAGRNDSEASPIRRLVKDRRKIFGKVMRLLSSIESHIRWQRWEPSIGGSFPTAAYEEMFTRVTRITGYVMLMSYALADAPLTETYGHGGRDGQEAAGVSGVDVEAQDKRESPPSVKVLQRTELMHHTVPSTLIMLSNALLSGQRLPPFLPMPQHGGTTANRKLQPEITAILASRGDGNSTLPSSTRALKMIDLRQQRHSPTSKQNTTSGCQPPRDDVRGASDGNSISTQLRIYLLTQVCGALVCNQVEGLARVVGRLVGVVDFGSPIDAGNEDVDVDDDAASHKLEKPGSKDIAAATRF